jgi:uncharacterized protein YbjT (DUF2867 family)
MATENSDTEDRILLTGATGYVGGHLLDRLEQAGSHVLCLTRRPAVLAQRKGPRTEVVAGDVLDRQSLVAAMKGVRAAYYLVHSMGETGDFEELDRRAAINFATAARHVGIGRIVYLGGLGSGEDLSAHLASRQQVGEILRGSGVPTIELRASIVIGAGSASFETIRALVEHLPAIPAPHWVKTAAQPIAIDDLVDYLVAALTFQACGSEIVEIGGSERVTYAEVMREYARQRNLRRQVIPTPLMTTRISRLFLGALSPRYGSIAAAMVSSLRNETVVREPTAESFSVRPRGLAAAVERALRAEDQAFAETHWSHALSSSSQARWGGIAVGRRIVSSRSTRVRGRAEEAFALIQRIGGATGWYAVDWFWGLRGSLDRLRGGAGLRRGRRDPYELQVGDAVDFWRVERLERGRKLLLCAEMKIPGRLWLQFEVQAGSTGAQIRQTTIFDPAGYAGLIYWYLLYPVHHRIFGAMLRGLARASGQATGSPLPG